MPVTLRGGIYRPRWQYWWPWGVDRPWIPRASLEADENCNPSILLILPLMGAIVVFWKPGPQRTDEDGPCEECLADLDEG